QTLAFSPDDSMLAARIDYEGLSQIRVVDLASGRWRTMARFKHPPNGDMGPRYPALLAWQDSGHVLGLVQSLQPPAVASSLWSYGLDGTTEELSPLRSQRLGNSTLSVDPASGRILVVACPTMALRSCQRAGAYVLSPDFVHGSAVAGTDRADGGTW